MFMAVVEAANNCFKMEIKNTLENWFASYSWVFFPPGVGVTHVSVRLSLLLKSALSDTINERVAEAYRYSPEKY